MCASRAFRRKSMKSRGGSSDWKRSNDDSAYANSKSASRAGGGGGGVTAMAISSIFGLFRARTKPLTEISEAKIKQGIERAAAVLAAYGKVLSEDKDSGLIGDIKRLPNSKEEIKAAIKVLLKVATDPAMHAHLRNGYI